MLIVTSSIALIHGQNGHWLDSFMDRGTGVCWTRDLLPQEQELSGIRLRVLSFSWDSETAMEDVVVGFLDALVEMRHKTKTEPRPILFVAHSMGGPILQSMLSIAQSRGSLEAPTKALFFGTSEKHFLKTENILSTMLELPSTSTYAPLVRDSKFLGTHTRAFHDLVEEGDIFECQYFLEGSGGREQIPLLDGEIQALPTQERIQLSKGHGPMIRYMRREEYDYRRIVICIGASIRHLLDLE
ncbi:hypothetical protein V5O48_016595 [Marasmius crinis-equi]|uniref:DUF676 domain-containing protein n=1 Tax=Marasmius crinis-equi TaxID=585013 RepID=A0ABR3ERB3_9AGAR